MCHHTGLIFVFLVEARFQIVKDGNQLIGFTAGSRVLLVAGGNQAQGQSPQAIVVDILAVIPEK